MVRLSVIRWHVALLALTWAGTATADSMVSPLFKTGDVEKDLPLGSSSVTVIPGQNLGDVYQPKWMTDEGRINGYVMKDIRLSYDKQTDTLAVGVNFWGVAGNVDGSPDGAVDPRTVAAGGSNPPHLGGGKAIVVGFTPVTAAGADASPLIVAGVPAVKGSSDAGLNGFRVATNTNSTSGLGWSFGTTLTAHQGDLAYDPTKAHPDFEFTIKNFSKIPGLDGLTKGFYVSAYAGTGTTIITGKSSIFNTLVGPPSPQGIDDPRPIDPPPVVTPPVPPRVPEPTTVLAWGLVAGGAAWRVRRRVRPSIRA